MPDWEGQSDFDLPKYTVEGEGNPFADKPGIDFEALLHERDGLRASIPKDFRKKTRDFLHNLYHQSEKVSSKDPERQDYVDGRCAPIVEAVAKRIKSETSIQKELEGIIDIEGISDIKKFMRLHRVKHAWFLGKYTAGAYHPFSGKISTPKDAYIQNKADTLYSLANGGFPDIVSTVTHELIHAEQSTLDKTRTATDIAAHSASIVYAISTVAMAYGVGLSGEDETLMYPILLSGLATLITRYRPKKWDELNPLHEAQAYKLPIKGYIQPNNAILQTLQDDEYRLRSPKQIDQCISALIDVDRLLALGYNHQRIAELCRNAEWDNKTKAYDTLHDSIEIIKEVRGLTDEEIGALIDSRRLEQQINRLKVQKITIEEIEKAKADK